MERKPNSERVNEGQLDEHEKFDHVDKLEEWLKFGQMWLGMDYEQLVITAKIVNLPVLRERLTEILPEHKNPNLDGMVSIETAAEILGCTERSIRRIIEKGHALSETRTVPVQYEVDKMFVSMSDLRSYRENPPKGGRPVKNLETR